MAAHIIPHLFEGEHLIRQVERDDDPWFVAADICRVLGIKNSRDAISGLDEDEKGVVLTDTPGGLQEVSIISEGGFYTLTLRSRAAMTPGTSQHRFRKWVTKEVIPAIRKTGAYAAAKAEEADAAGEARESDAIKLRKVAECCKIFGLQAGAQLWFKLGLDDVPAMHIDPRQITIWDFANIKTTGEGQ